MSEIKAIETYYKGYRFRSRLEARWAVFFDAAGIKYEYEPEGFISIHVLREEDDGVDYGTPEQIQDFNPRPPRGGRP